MQFFRVQVGIQSPEATTTTRLILRRFSDFAGLYSEVRVFSTLHSLFLLFLEEFEYLNFFFLQLKKEFAMKNLPPLPPKKMLRIKSHALLEEVGT